jgi:hypothetical protein
VSGDAISPRRSYGREQRPLELNAMSVARPATRWRLLLCTPAALEQKSVNVADRAWKRPMARDWRSTAGCYELPDLPRTRSLEPDCRVRREQGLRGTCRGHAGVSGHDRSSAAATFVSVHVIMSR